MLPSCTLFVMLGYLHLLLCCNQSKLPAAQTAIFTSHDTFLRALAFAQHFTAHGIELCQLGSLACFQGCVLKSQSFQLESVALCQCLSFQAEVPKSVFKLKNVSLTAYQAAAKVIGLQHCGA